MDLSNLQNFVFAGPDPFKVLLWGSLLIFALASLILFYHWWKYRGDGILIWLATIIYSIGGVFLLMTVLAAYSVFAFL